jgi:hypothetical protein
MFVVLSGRVLCDGLITRPEESYRLWCVVVCDLETSWMRRPLPTGSCCTPAPPPKKIIWFLVILSASVGYCKYLYDPCTEYILSKKNSKFQQ